jgi:exosome complex RNA-binding protein Csl4
MYPSIRAKALSRTKISLRCFQATPKKGSTVAAKLNRVALEAATVRATSDSAQCSVRYRATSMQHSTSLHFLKLVPQWLKAVSAAAANEDSIDEKFSNLLVSPVYLLTNTELRF